MRVTHVESSDRVVLATLGRAHGIRGSIRARVYNTETELLDPGSVVRVSPPDAEDPNAFVECSIEQCQRGKDAWVLKLAGVDDRNGAEELSGALVWIAREALPKLEEGEFYLFDAPGFAVVDEAGAPVGKVLRIETYPTADAMVVALDREAGGEIEVPIVEGVVISVDHSNKRFVVAREVIDSLTES